MWVYFPKTHSHFPTPFSIQPLRYCYLPSFRRSTTMIIKSFLLLILISSVLCSPFKVVNSRITLNGLDVILHGVNIVYKVAPYVPITDRFDPQLSLSEEDAKFLQQRGFFSVRLGLSLEGLIPTPWTIDYSYLDKIESIVNMLGKYNIFSLIDLHQDIFSPRTCGNGFPTWFVDELNLFDVLSTFPSPVHHTPYNRTSDGNIPLDQCLSTGFGEYYMSHAVGACYDELFTNPKGIKLVQQYWEAVSLRFKNNNNILGYNIVNEPFPGSILKDPTLVNPGVADKKRLLPFYKVLFKTIRDVDPNTPLFFEGFTTDVFALGFNPSDLDFNNTVLSFHTYCMHVDKGIPKDDTVCTFQEVQQFDIRMKDVKRLGTGYFMTEFGAVHNDSVSIRDLQRVLSLADQYKSGWMYWSYKGFNDPTTASTADLEGFWNLNGDFQPAKVATLTRPYPTFVAGVLESSYLLNNKYHVLYKARGGETSKFFFGSVFTDRRVSLNSRNCSFQLTNLFVEITCTVDTDVRVSLSWTSVVV
ncbi:hypothetical protein RCL1_009009 [Eukaryota sp. TZLM3-RCL]